MKGMTAEDAMQIATIMAGAYICFVALVLISSYLIFGKDKSKSAKR